MLGNRRRRYILCYLLDQNSPTECSELAKQIAAWENNLESDQVQMSQYQSVYNSLYQTHLPKLESAGLIEYDRSENLVYHTKKMTEVNRFMDTGSPGLNDRLTHHFPLLKGGVLFTSLVAVMFVVSPARATYLFLVGAVVICVMAILLLGGHR